MIARCKVTALLALPLADCFIVYLKYQSRRAVKVVIADERALCLGLGGREESKGVYRNGNCS